jgi:AraC-like DNA-binding protein
LKRYRLIWTVVLACLYCGVLWADVTYPSNAEVVCSFENSIKKGNLPSFYNLCLLLNPENSKATVLTDVESYRALAHRLGDVNSEGYAMAYRIHCFNYFGMTDSVMKLYPRYSEFMREHNLWSYYYTNWFLYIRMYILNNKFQLALVESRKMYDDAIKRKSKCGIGVSSFALGNMYFVMRRFSRAETYFRESVSILSQCEIPYMLLLSYSYLCRSLNEEKHYDQLRIVANQWQHAMAYYNSMKNSWIYILYARYASLLAIANVEIGEGKIADAKVKIDEAEGIYEHHKCLPMNKLLLVKAVYYVAVKDYAKAMSCNSRNILLYEKYSDMVGMLSVEKQQAELFMLEGKQAEAAGMYKEIIEKTDSLHDSQMAIQIDDLSKIYTMDKMRSERQKAKTRFYLVFSLCVILTMAVSFYIFYTRRLLRKNRFLYDNIQRSRQMDYCVRVTEGISGKGSPDNKKLIFEKLCKAMKEDQLFKNPQLRREDLALKIGTNYAYLADAVKQYANGITILEFINRFRLSYAAHLLTEELDMPINMVGEESGFNSRSTYNRLFRDYYGMAPSDYRTISKEKKKEIQTAKKSVFSCFMF